MRVKSLEDRTTKMSEQLANVSKTFDIKNRKQKVILNPNTSVVKKIFDESYKNQSGENKIYRSDFLINYLKIKNTYFE